MVVLLLTTACGKTKEPIEYGSDNCHHCQMRIMDPKFGAESITSKGRCYKFDSAECLLHYVNETESKHSHLYVTDFDQPKTLIDATQAFYLVSENMPSPMGGYLNAFTNKSNAEKHQDINGGEIFNWETLKSQYQE